MSLKQVRLSSHLVTSYDMEKTSKADLGYIQEIETWVAALTHYDNNEFDEALAQFSQIADTSKILFNMGVIHATLGDHEKAVWFFVIFRKMVC